MSENVYVVDSGDYRIKPKVDMWGVKCNLIAGHSAVHPGANGWVSLTNPGNCGDRIEVLIRSRGGRRIKLWFDSAKLTNFRAAWIPFNLRERLLGASWNTREEAEAWAQENHKPILADR